MTIKTHLFWTKSLTCYLDGGNNSVWFEELITKWSPVNSLNASGSVQNVLGMFKYFLLFFICVMLRYF